jgi:GTP diphosphokinase / guanosine-3',5'-bis(diphosphate) 3'-diphosphatase
MDALLDDLISVVRRISHPVDEKKVIKAWEFANLAHSGQKRLSGEAYIIHPTQVAKTLASWNLDTTTIIAGLLHDTIEDGGATRADLVKGFGEDIAQLVDGVTKITGIHLKGSTEEQFVENLRKMLLVMARDLRVILVKLADRLHNMQTLQYLSPPKQYENARETLEIYAPLAERLGIGEIKGILEDLAFPYVYPDEYHNLYTRTRKLYAEGKSYIEKFKRQLLSYLVLQIPNAVINTRHKHIYSLFRKLQRPEINYDLNKIHDIAAARVIVDTAEQCYLTLGIIHSHYHPVPYLGIRDFIANPKPNGYRSIHTNVFGPGGRIVEIQIRTHQMHREAEMGIAAHWQYSDAKSTGVSEKRLEKGIISAPQDKLNWVKQLVSWQKELSDSKEYLQALKFDALQHRNLVFSPIGDVYDLPRGATPVDYAYAVHTELGNHTAGAKVNGKMEPLDYKLANGDIVEVIVDKTRAKPSSDWLEFVVTTTARREIAKAIRN